jgi:glycosyltransferase involved in cell wall biosynthesis
MSDGRVSILLVCHSYPPVLGGSEIEAQRVCVELTKRGHRVQVLCAGGDPMPPVRRWIDPMGIPVRLFGARWQEPWRNRAFALGVAWTMLRERRKYDLVYFLMPGLHLAFGVVMARLLGKPGVMKVGGSGILPVMAQSWLGRRELNWLRRWAHRILILNDGMVQEGLQVGFEREQLMWMPNPVDTDEFAPCNPEERARLRAKLGIPSAAQVLIYVGRLAPEKALDSLIEGFAIAAPKVRDSILVLVGDGPMRRTLEELAQKLAPERIRFAGRQSGKEVLEWLRVSDVFGLVSINEGFPCALVEAMSAGLASVVSDIPANTQLIEQGVHGQVAKLGDRASIGACIAELLANPKSREEMGNRARQVVTGNYSSAKIGDRYEDLFRGVLKLG